MGSAAHKGNRAERAAMNSLTEAFDEYFEILEAATPELLRQAQRVRFVVYCQEKGFEDPDDHPDGLERDEYDDRSVHCVLRYKLHERKGSPEFVANVRLVLIDPAEPRAPFPIETHCGCGFWDPQPFKGVPRESIAEISRFAVISDFRRRRDDGDGPHGLKEVPTDASPDERRHTPPLVVGLFRATLQLSVAHGVTHWYAVMEPTLFRLLRRFGVHFEQIGEDVEYRGLRRPCKVGIGDMLEKMHRERREVWEFMTDEGRLWPAPARAVTVVG